MWRCVCVCVFIQLVSPEFCLWGNTSFLFPALLANDNLIHPGENRGGVEGERRWRERGKGRDRRGVEKRWVVVKREPPYTDEAIKSASLPSRTVGRCNCRATISVSDPAGDTMPFALFNPFFFLIAFKSASFAYAC